MPSIIVTLKKRERLCRNFVRDAHNFTLDLQHVLSEETIRKVQEAASQVELSEEALRIAIEHERAKSGR